MTQQDRRALVVGLGIAGLATAIGLRQAGWEPVVVERAPERRTGGYFVGVFPEGKTALADLGASENLHVRNPVEGKDWTVGRSGRARPGAGFLDRPGGPYAVVRGDIEDALWRTLDDLGGAEVRFGTRPVGIEQTPEVARVRLLRESDGAETVEEFALVVGADGVRSGVRRLAFGPDDDYLDQWGAIICAFELDEQVPGLGPEDGSIDARSRRAAWVFGFADRTPTALLTYRTEDVDAQFTRPPVETLRTVYAGMDHPSVTHVLDQLEKAPHFLFDSVSQVRMPSWRAGRVVLVGDAAWCLNLYSGMGSSMAMRGGADLGKALRDHPEDLEAAVAERVRAAVLAGLGAVGRIANRKDAGSKPADAGKVPAGAAVRR